MEEEDFATLWAGEPTDEIVKRHGQIEDLLRQSCDCAPARQAVRLRTLGNGSKHKVLQCQGCGEQRGSMLNRKQVQELLGDRVPEPFDEQLRDSYTARRLTLYAEQRALLDLWREREYPEAHQGLLHSREEDEARAERVRAALAHCIERLNLDLSEAQVADALANEAIEIRRRHRAELVAATRRFTSEDELKAWLVDHLSADFILSPEAAGKHLAEGVRVQIDYMAYPKPHLITQGFEPVHFGIEVKYVDQTDGFSHKASRGIWQTVSYTDSAFQVGGEWHKPKFALLFSNLSFEDERNLLENVGKQVENDRMIWRALLQLANHANVGTLDILGKRDGWRGWEMKFSSGMYFQRHTREGRPVYRLSNANMINKIRIGNF